MIIGIDLGTTNSLAAVWQDGQARIVPNALGHSLTPSAVGVDDNRQLLVGLAARERLISHPQQTAALFKRYTGSKRLIRLGEHFLQIAIVDQGLSLDCDDPALRAAIRNQAEKTKRRLSAADSATPEIL